MLDALVEGAPSNETSGLSGCSSLGKDIKRDIYNGANNRNNFFLLFGIAYLVYHMRAEKTGRSNC